MSSDENTETIWFQAPSELLSARNFASILPTADMPDANKLNSFFRLSIYVGAFAFLCSNKVKYLYIPIAVGAFTVFMFSYYQTVDEKYQNNFVHRGWAELGETGQPCKLPTRDNPFMNVTLNEYLDDPERPPACPIDHPDIKKVMQNKMGVSIRDVDDIFHKNPTDWHFYTVANTEIPNRQTDYASWLYGGSKSCKEDGAQCARNIPTRVNLY
jgi:hypothetical protein